MSELEELRYAVYCLATDDVVKRTAEEWYDKLWELLDPVIDARAEKALGAHRLPAGELPAWAKGLNPIPGLND